MIRTALAATTLLAASPAFAQSTTQEEIDARYDRALAAGYKALFLCSAIFNAKQNGAAARTPWSVQKWELTGIQPPFDELVAELPFEVRGVLHRPGAWRIVYVKWSEDMPDRMALFRPDGGCSLAPIGSTMWQVRMAPAVQPVEADAEGSPRTELLEFGAVPQSKVENAAFAERYGEGTRTTAVLVAKDGAVIREQYHEDFGPRTPQRTWSVAKSIAASIVGAAVQRGKADAEAAAGLGASGRDPRREITINHLLRMASGRYSDTPGNRTDLLYFGGSTVEETAMHWPLVSEPGTIYRYANNDTLAAIKAIEQTFETNPPSAFLATVGMKDTVAETDWSGDYILSSQVWATARDLAKLGQLYLDDGVLPDGARILPEGWVEYVSTPSGPQPDGPFGYGAGFWLLNKSEGIPPDTIAAMGNRGQFIIIIPSMNVVIVRRGEDPVGSRFDIAAFTRDVLESLEKR